MYPLLLSPVHVAHCDKARIPTLSWGRLVIDKVFGFDEVQAGGLHAHASGRVLRQSRYGRASHWQRYVFVCLLLLTCCDGGYSLAAERIVGSWTLSSGFDFETGTHKRAFSTEVNRHSARLFLEECDGPVLPFILEPDENFWGGSPMKLADGSILAWILSKEDSIPILLGGGMDGYYFDVIGRRTGRSISAYFDWDNNLRICPVHDDKRLDRCMAFSMKDFASALQFVCNKVLR
jgi:hypothetical protein